MYNQSIISHTQPNTSCLARGFPNRRF